MMDRLPTGHPFRQKLQDDGSADMLFSVEEPRKAAWGMAQPASNGQSSTTLRGGECES
eukprot:CAMPEP_0172627666 /NCGR_PEP_ID=MMETSP1068-20121228/157574_1 /TAXON_ID=35684 /ORGANISM="Pseudopedinella elastica, Strain CCMP716" /LENGTH=57 /DNA_ID=CAMNT_0013437641 /DNA_START=570 /DNA_END=743 /DNA_ORIENTATION=-